MTVVANAGLQRSHNKICAVIALGVFCLAEILEAIAGLLTRGQSYGTRVLSSAVIVILVRWLLPILITLKVEKIRVIRGAGGEYIHLDDLTNILVLMMNHLEALGETFNVAGLWCYQEEEVAWQIIDMVNSKSKLELVEDSGQQMISVSVGKLQHKFAYQFEHREFLSGLIRSVMA